MFKNPFLQKWARCIFSHSQNRKIICCKTQTAFPSPHVCRTFRLLVECRYIPGSVSVSYMVKTPTLGPTVHTQGVFGVQLRIAKGKVSRL